MTEEEQQLRQELQRRIDDAQSEHERVFYQKLERLLNAKN